MPEWLQKSFLSDPNLTPSQLLVRLAVSFVLGCVVAAVFKVTRKPTGDGGSFLATLVLLTILISMITMVIGDSTARAFSLVGALAIVRFRTVVEDTRDTAFVILAVAVGMAVGAGYIQVPLLGLPFAAVAAYIFQPGRRSTDLTLVVRVGLGHRPDDILKGMFEKHLEQSRLLSTATARQGAALELTYSARLRRPDGAVPLVSELNAVEGIQGVELRQT